MPSRRWRVVCGRGETMLTLAPTRALTSVDLPTLGRPMTAMVPARYGCRRSSAQSPVWSSTAASAAACSAARSELPSAVGVDGRVAHAAARRGRCARGRRRWSSIRVYSGAASCRACSHSCNRVLASFSTLPIGSCVDQRLEPGQHALAAGLETGVEVDRADQRLQRVGQDRVAAMAAGLHFARAQLQPVAEVQCAGDGRPGRIRAPARRGPGSARLRRPWASAGSSASATIRLTSASPRNSRRSLCGAPALRWRRACAQQAGIAKRMTEAVSHRRSCCPSGSVSRAELDHEVEVVDERLAHFVVHGQHVAGLVADRAWRPCRCTDST